MSISAATTTKAVVISVILSVLTSSVYILLRCFFKIRFLDRFVVLKSEDSDTQVQKYGGSWEWFLWHMIPDFFIGIMSPLSWKLRLLRALVYEVLVIYPRQCSVRSYAKIDSWTKDVLLGVVVSMIGFIMGVLMHIFAPEWLVEPQLTS